MATKASLFSEDVCVICCKLFRTETGEKAVKVQEGRDRLMQCSSQREDRELSEYLMTNPLVVHVHESCRKEYVYVPVPHVKRPLITDDVEETGKVKFLRSAVESFDWKRNCFLCGKPAVKDTKHPGSRSKVREAKTDKVTQNMLRLCEERQDNWAFEVKGRLMTCGDLHAADAVYHVKCHRDFTDPTFDVSVSVPSAHFVDHEKYAVFDVLCDTLEHSDSELYTVNELINLMKSLSVDDTAVYSFPYMKQKLQERFGDSIFFADVCGRSNVVCFRNVAHRIITDKWYANRDSDIIKESYRIVEAAAKLIRANIHESVARLEEYPSNSSIRDRELAKQWVPSLLRLFLQTLISDEIKQVAVGHSIVQASGPRGIISPVLFGVGVSIDHVTGSKALLQLMSRYGFSVSYDEVNRFKQSVVQMDVEGKPAAGPANFTQWAADNVDHNVATLDGLGTFHGMGMISMTMPCSSPATAAESVGYGMYGDQPVKRLPRVTVDTIARAKTVKIHYFSQPNIPALLGIQFEPILKLQNGEL